MQVYVIESRNQYPVSAWNDVRVRRHKCRQYGQANIVSFLLLRYALGGTNHLLQTESHMVCSVRLKQKIGILCSGLARFYVEFLTRRLTIQTTDETKFEYFIMKVKRNKLLDTIKVIKCEPINTECNRKTIHKCLPTLMAPLVKAIS